MERCESNSEGGRRLLPAIAAMMFMHGGCANEYELDKLPGEIDANLTECNDEHDNDGDGDVDDFDSDCENADDEVEGTEPLWEQYEDAECSDGSDNDGDGWPDEQDADCYDYVVTSSGESAFMYLPWDDSEKLAGYQPMEE